MNRIERTIDVYPEDLVKKFKVQSRVGLVLEAIRRDFVERRCIAKGLEIVALQSARVRKLN